MSDRLTVLVGDCRQVLKTLPDESVNCCISSPPYWQLRDYNAPGQIGLEPTPEEYVETLAGVFREVRRVLRKDGTLWLNLGDTFASSGGHRDDDVEERRGKLRVGERPKRRERPSFRRDKAATGGPAHKGSASCKPKDLIGIPWAVAKALRDPFYSGRVAKDIERVWLAATLEAEGSICAFDHERADGTGHRSGISITITNTSSELLDEAHRIWPASRSEHEHHSEGHRGGLPSWRWIAHGVENKIALLRELYPYMISKRKQAVTAYTMLLLMADAKRLGHSPLRDEVRGKRAVLTKLLSDLNNRRETCLPDWLKEPETLLSDGWFLRQHIPWIKRNAMPDSAKDRPQSVVETVFLLSKSRFCYYDFDSIKLPTSPSYRNDRRWKTGSNDNNAKDGYAEAGARNPKSVHRVFKDGEQKERQEWRFTRNSDWFFEGIISDERGEPLAIVCPTAASKEKHFAVFPERFVVPMVLAGCPADGVVLDPFAGTGTVGKVALELGRRAVLIELNGDEYAGILERKANAPQPGLPI